MIDKLIFVKNLSICKITRLHYRVVNVVSIDSFISIKIKEKIII